MIRKASLALLLLPLLLTGCVEVELKVNSRGKITQTFTAVVSQRAADVLKAAAQNYLGRNWQTIVERKGEMNILKTRLTYKPQPKANPMPGLTVDFRRRNRWFKATYELRIQYKPNEIFQTKDEQFLVAERKLTARIYMPGRIIPEQSDVTFVEGNMAELTLDPLSKAEIRIVSVGMIWWLVGLAVLFLALLVWAISPYIPRLIERLRRPSVKVV
ncbi:MAG: hypothetical protein NZ937_03510 [Armatimonadetes bacterium]|nr:hypothetical protein [Armatimonadota bacterium]